MRLRVIRLSSDERRMDVEIEGQPGVHWAVRKFKFKSGTPGALFTRREGSVSDPKARQP